MLYAFPIFNFPDNFPQVYNFLLHQSVTSTSCKIPTARIQAEADTKTATTTFCSSEKLFTRDQGMDGFLPLRFLIKYFVPCVLKVSKNCLHVWKCPKTFWKYCWNVIRINQWSSLNKCSICFRLVKRGQDKNWIIPESLWAETTTTMNSTLTLEIVILRQILMFLRLTWTCLKYEIANVSTWTWKHSEITKRKKIAIRIQLKLLE